jgi:hypothetical protein
MRKGTRNASRYLLVANRPLSNKTVIIYVNVTLRHFHIPIVAMEKQ